jgi:hypothetical protein
MKVSFFALFFVVCAALLTGCTREPSDEEITKIITLSIKEDASSLVEKTFLGVNLGYVLGIDQLRINQIEKISCDPMSTKKVTCQVLVDFEFVNRKDGLSEMLGGIPKTRKIVEYQFVKLNQGWQVLEPLGQK